MFGEPVLSFRFPFLSSFNHSLNWLRKLPRFLLLAAEGPAFGPGVDGKGCDFEAGIPGGDPTGVDDALLLGTAEDDSVRTQGDPIACNSATDASDGGGVVGGRGGGDFVSLEGPPPLPCELLDSSPTELLVDLGPLSASFSFSFSFSFVLTLSFSRCSLTASEDFFLTRPAASKAVVALCIMLTLPDLFARPFPVLPEGVVGFEVALADEDGVRSGVLPPGDIALVGGVLGRLVGAVGVGGTTPS